MKVLHVIPSVSPALGGPTQVVLNLVQGLRKQGIEAEIVTTNDNGTTLLDVPLNEKVEYEGVPIWFLPRFSPPLKEFIFSPAITRWMWKHLQNYDILDNHYLFSYAPTCAGAIARWYKIPYTVRTMGQLTPWALAQSRLKKQVYTHLIERHNLNCAATIHCTTPGEAEDVRNFGIQTPTLTIPLGVKPFPAIENAADKLRQVYGIGSDTPIILFLSRLHYKKRPDLLLKTLHNLRNQDSQFHLLLAGSGESDYVEELQALGNSLGLTDYLTFTGLVTGEAKDLLLQGSDLFVLPSFSENFGIAVAEALINGLPVVTTAGVQIAPEIKNAQAGIIVEGEIESLGTAIAQLLQSPQLRQQLGQNGKHLAQTRYAWDAIATELGDAYGKIIAQQ